MITRKELITSEEYWKEIIDNLFWRVFKEKSLIPDEREYLLEKIKELIDVNKLPNE